MRKLLLILLLIPFFADAQVWQQNNLEYGHQFKGLKSLRALLLPLAETTAGQGRDTGAVYYRLADSSLYVYTGSQWRQVTGSGGSSYTFSNGVKESGGSVTAGGTFEADSISYVSNSSKVFRIQSRAAAGSVNLSDVLFSPTTSYTKVTGASSNIFTSSTLTSAQIEHKSTQTDGTTTDILIAPAGISLRRYGVAISRMLKVASTIDFSNSAGTLITNSFGADSSIHYKKLVYGDNYRSLFTDYTLVDKGWVDSVLATISVGEVNTGSNVGGGAEVFKQKTGVDFVHRTILGTGGITVSQNTNDITISGNADSSAARVRTGTYAQRVAITSPQEGEIFTQTDRLSGLYMYTHGSWRFQGDPLSYWYYTQFSKAGANTAGEGYNATTSFTGAAAGDFDIIQRNYSDPWLRALLKATDVTVTTIVNDNLYVDSMTVWHETEFEIDAVSDGTDSYGMTWGYDNSAGNYLTGDRIVFRYNHAVNSGNWETRTVAAGSGTWTTKNTGVAFAANTRTKLAIEINGYTQTINFYINDVLVTTHTSPDNVPFPNATTLATSISKCMFNFDRLAGTTTRTFNINYVFGYFVKKNF